MTVDAPNTGRATTRLNWLLRQLRDSKGQVCIETTALRQRGKGAVRTLAELRETPKLAIDSQSAWDMHGITIRHPTDRAANPQVKDQ